MLDTSEDLVLNNADNNNLANNANKDSGNTAEEGGNVLLAR